ncbi:hypothetical protein ACFY1A_48220 [Streptomyces sp. NPDC001520]|uniref:hypothetical protein n=1 Tax=Streptomyces sp. NPDC001520 TaxID=3364581 RepID=UPI0036B18778
MAFWKRLFGRGKEEGPTPAAPPPEAPPAAPAAGEEPAAGKGGGLFARLLGRGKGKKEEAPPPEAPPAAPAAGEGGEGGEAPPPPAPAPPPPPSSLSVTIPGRWQISSTTWGGTIRGTLHGQGVVTFLNAMDKGDLDTAVYLVAQQYGAGSGFADLLDLSASMVHDVRYDLPGG